MNTEEIVRQLQAERSRLDQAIQALQGGNVPKKRGRKPGSTNATAAQSTPEAPRRRGRPPLTPAQKKRLSEQMKKRWAERKAASSKK